MKPVDRPGFTITYRLPDGQIVACDANHIGYGMQGGRYVVHFVTSGGLTVVSAAEVERVSYHPHGPSFCGQCDAQLVTWPSEDRAYAAKP